MLIFVFTFDRFNLNEKIIFRMENVFRMTRNFFLFIIYFIESLWGWMGWITCRLENFVSIEILTLIYSLPPFYTHNTHTYYSCFVYAQPVVCACVVVYFHFANLIKLFSLLFALIFCLEGGDKFIRTSNLQYSQ